MLAILLPAVTRCPNTLTSIDLYPAGHRTRESCGGKFFRALWKVLAQERENTECAHKLLCLLYVTLLGLMRPRHLGKMHCRRAELKQQSSKEDFEPS
jgi:hypothetical protein